VTAAPAGIVQHGNTDDARRRETALDLAAASGESLAELDRAAASIITYTALSVAETRRMVDISRDSIRASQEILTRCRS
jgi:hypothetical protein